MRPNQSIQGRDPVHTAMPLSSSIGPSADDGGDVEVKAVVQEEMHRQHHLQCERKEVQRIVVSLSRLSETALLSSNRNLLHAAVKTNILARSRTHHVLLLARVQFPSSPSATGLFHLSERLLKGFKLYAPARLSFSGPDSAAVDLTSMMNT